MLSLPSLLSSLLSLLLFLSFSFLPCSAQSFIPPLLNDAYPIGCYSASSGINFWPGAWASGVSSASACQSVTRANFHALFAYNSASGGSCFSDYNEQRVILNTLSSFAVTCAPGAFQLYRVVYPPVIHSISPQNQPTSTTAVLTILGRGFWGDNITSTLTVGFKNLFAPFQTAACTLVGAYTDTRITCRIPQLQGNAEIVLAVGSRDFNQLPRFNMFTIYDDGNALGYNANCFNLTNSADATHWQTMALCLPDSVANLDLIWTEGAAPPGYTCQAVLPGRELSVWGGTPPVKVCMPNSLTSSYTFSVRVGLLPGGTCFQIRNPSCLAFTQAAVYFCHLNTEPPLINGKLHYIYTRPVINSVSRLNIPTTGNVPITLFGSSFGNLASGPVVTMSSLTLSSTLTISSYSHTQIAVTIPPGEGRQYTLNVTVGGKSLATANLFNVSYDAPILSSISPTSGATLGGYNLVLAGSNFGSTMGSVWFQAVSPFPGSAPRFFSLPIVSWADTQIVATLNVDGAGTSRPVRIVTFIDTDIRSWNVSFTSGFSFLPPTLSSVTSSTVDTGQNYRAGNYLLTLTGVNFGTSTFFGSSVMVDGLTCSLSPGTGFWNDSQIICTMPSVTCFNCIVTVRASGQSASNTFTTTAPTLVPTASTSMNPFHGWAYIVSPDIERPVHNNPSTLPLIGDGVTSLTGYSLGNGSSPDQRVIFGSVNISSMSVTVSAPFTYVRFNAPYGQIWGPRVPVQFHVTGQVTGVVTYTFAPEIIRFSSDYGRTYPTLGGYRITVWGKNFPNWPDVSTNNVLDMTKLVNLAFVRFQYQIDPWRGGASDLTPVDYIYPTNATDPLGYRAINGLVVIAPQAQYYCYVWAGARTPVANGQTWTLGSFRDGFGWEAPVIQSIFPTTGPTAGFFNLTLYGRSFGNSFTPFPLGSSIRQAAVAVDNADACWVSFQNHSMAICTFPPGAGASISIQVFHNSITFSNVFNFSYYPPFISRMSPTNGSVNGGQVVSLWGTDFYNGRQYHVNFDAQVIPFTIVNGSFGTFVIPDGFQKTSRIFLFVDIAGQSSNIMTWTYTPPTIDSLLPPPYTIDTSGYEGPASPLSFILTLYGSNFALAAKVLVGGRNCDAYSDSFRVLNSTTFYCKTPPGEATKQVQMVIAGNAPSNLLSITYAKPRLAAINPTNGATSGEPVVVTGFSFGQTVGAVTVNGMGCLVQAWDHKQITCVVSPGPQIGSSSRGVVNVTANGFTTQEVVYYQYNAPKVDSIDPAQGPTSGNQTIFVRGNNFGLRAFAFVSGNPCPAHPLFPQTHSVFVCTLPAFQGINLPFWLNVSDRGSVPFPYTYQPPTISSITPLLIGTDGSTRITLTGTNLGSMALAQTQITVQAVSATNLVINGAQTQVIFNAPSATGLNKQTVLTVSGQTVVSSSQFLISYLPPTITRVSGCQGDTANEAKLCPIQGNQPLTIYGSNFGNINSNLTVTVLIGNSALGVPGLPLICPLLSVNHTQIICNLPAFSKGGYFLPVTVIIDTQVSNSTRINGVLPSVSYAGPTITPGSLRISMSTNSYMPKPLNTGSTKSYSNALGGLSLELNSTDGWPADERIVVFNGTFLGNDINEITVRYDWHSTFSGSPTQPSQAFSARKFACQVLYVFTVATQDKSGFVICRLQEGVGQNLTFSILVVEQFSEEGQDAINYPLPRLVGGGLNIFDPIVSRDTVKSAAIFGQYTTGDVLEMDAIHIGSDRSLLDVFFYQPDDPINSLRKCDLKTDPYWGIFGVKPRQFITCKTAPGFGKGFKFQITANGATGPRGNDTYNYVTPPSISRVNDPIGVNDDVATFNQPTTGGHRITISGDAFGSSGLTVFTGTVQCVESTFIDVNTISCVTSPSTGLNQPVTVVVGTQFSQPVNSLSYQVATVESLDGCEPFKFGSVNPRTGLPNVVETRNCSRFGGDLLTVIGDSFGPAVPPPTIIVGGQVCTAVTSLDDVTQTRFQCSLPQGTRTRQPVLFIQAFGPPTLSPSFVTFRQCFPGTYAPLDVVNCDNCPAGRFTDTDGLFDCKICPDGYSSQPGSNACSPCDIGRFAVAGSTGASTCSPCSNGTFSSAIGQPACSRCPTGSYQNGTGASTCLPCERGKFANVSGSFQCQDCPAGQSALFVGSSKCEQCPPGTYAPVPGLPSCLPCPAGTIPDSRSLSCVNCTIGEYAAVPGSSVCLACDPGTFADRRGMSACDKCSPGRSTNGLGNQTTCFNCLIGQYTNVPGLPSCLLCPPGSFSNSTRTANCPSCPVGRSNSAIGQTVCVDCAIGRSAPFPRAIFCDDCAPGTKAPRTGQQLCDPCEAGKFNWLTGRTACFDCPPGRFSGIGLPDCRDCPSGRYNPDSGNSSCLACPKGYFSVVGAQTSLSPVLTGLPAPNHRRDVISAGARVCTGCPTGRVASNDGLSECSPCEAGYFGNATAQSDCLRCAAGRFTGATGQSVCTNCAEGKYAPISASSTCISCGAGLFGLPGVTGLSSCSICPVGRYQEFAAAPNGVTGCKICDPGRFAAAPAQSSCGLCTPGFYNPFSEASSCIACSSGSYQANSGQASCDLADPGYFVSGNGATKKQPCSLGTYSPSSNRSSCLPCIAGQIANRVASSACFNCSTGFYTAASGERECQVCPAGKFAGAPGSTACSTCLAGTYNGLQGASSCIRCDPGYVSSTDGQKSCIPCVGGFFNNGSQPILCDACTAGQYTPPADSSQLGYTSCLRCPAGQFNSAPAQPGCKACAIGLYANQTGMSECMDCDVGSQALSEGSAFCDACAPGRFTDQRRTPQCFPCLPGEYTPGYGFTGCLKCQPGRYQDKIGQSQCDYCPTGRFEVGNASILCAECRVGTYADQLGFTECLQCLGGSYADRPRQSTCTPCPSGTFSQGGASVCRECVAGKYAPSNASTNCVDCQPGRFSEIDRQSTCDLCPIGRSAIGGQTSCAQCDSDKIAPFPGTGPFCVKCPTLADADENRIACECPLGYAAKPASPEDYARPYDSSRVVCRSCPKGAVCNQPGLRFDRLEAQNGYWRTRYVPLVYNETDPLSLEMWAKYNNPDSLNWNPKFFPCLDARFCLGGLNLNPPTDAGFYLGSTCRGNRVGPVCNLCAEGYTEELGGNCRFCGPPANAMALFIFIAVAVTVGLIIMFYIILQANKQLFLAAELAERVKRKTNTVSKLEAPSALSGGVGLAPVVQPGAVSDRDEYVAIAGETGGAISNVKQSVKQALLEEFSEEYDDLEKESLAALHRYDHNWSFTGPPKPIPNFTFKLKIVIGFAQIVSNMAINMPVGWPSSFLLFVSFFNPVNFDFVKQSNFGCVADDSHFNKLAIVCSTPLIIGLALLVFFFIPGYLRNPGSSQIAQIARKQVRQKFWLMFLYVLFIFYPFASSTITATYVCRTYGDQTILYTDMRRSCDTAQWEQYSKAAIGLIFVYPVGVPCFFFFMLWRYRKRLQEPAVRAEIGFLFDAFHHEQWFFELIDMMHKFILVSVLLTMPDDVQLPVGLVVVGLMFFALLINRPYLRKADDRLHLLAQMELLLLFQAGLVFKTQFDFDPVYDVVLSVTLILIIASFLLLFLLQSIHALRRWRLDNMKASAKERQKKIEQRLKEKTAKGTADDIAKDLDDNLQLNVMPELENRNMRVGRGGLGQEGQLQDQEEF